jgi:hypothetical protein
MPDLSADAVAVWLYSHEPAIAADLARAVPSGEEHELVLPAILRLGTLMDDALAHAPDALRSWLLDDRVLTNARQTLAQIGQGRRLRLLHWLAEVPGLDDLPMTLLGSDASDATRFLQAEIRNLHRRALLGRMFSPERITALLAACNAAL